MVSWGPIHRLYSDWWPKQSGWTSLKIKVGVQRVYWTSAVWTCLCNQIFVTLKRTSQPEHKLTNNIKTDIHVFARSCHLCWSMQTSCQLKSVCCNSRYVFWFFWIALNPTLSCLSCLLDFPRTGMRMNLNLITTLVCLPTLLITPLPGPVLKIVSQSCETVDTNW